MSDPLPLGPFPGCLQCGGWGCAYCSTPSERAERSGGEQAPTADEHELQVLRAEKHLLELQVAQRDEALGAIFVALEAKKLEGRGAMLALEAYEAAATGVLELFGVKGVLQSPEVLLATVAGAKAANAKLRERLEAWNALGLSIVRWGLSSGSAGGAVKVFIQDISRLMGMRS